MRHVWPDMLSVLPAQKRRATGEIRTPDTVRNGDYDLICIGSPTWWQTVSMPMRSFLKSDEARKLLAGKPFAVFVVCRQYWRENLMAVRELAEKQGGRYVDGIHFTYPGDQLRSMLSLTSYLGAVNTATGTWVCAFRAPTSSRSSWSRRETSRLPSRIDCSGRDRRARATGHPGRLAGYAAFIRGVVRIARQRRTSSFGVQRRGLLAGPARGLRRPTTRWTR